MYTAAFVTIAGLALSATAAPVAASPLDIGNGHMQLQINIDLTGKDAVAANAIDGQQLFAFSSTHFVHAVPEEVVNGTEATGGLAGASGTFNFGINSASNMICYNITLHNFQGEFDSPATTATHIHEAARGAS